MTPQEMTWIMNALGREYGHWEQVSPCCQYGEVGKKDEPTWGKYNSTAAPCRACGNPVWVFKPEEYKGNLNARASEALR